MIYIYIYILLLLLSHQQRKQFTSVVPSGNQVAPRLASHAEFSVGLVVWQEDLPNIFSSALAESVSHLNYVGSLIVDMV